MFRELSQKTKGIISLIIISCLIAGYGLLFSTIFQDKVMGVAVDNLSSVTSVFLESQNESSSTAQTSTSLTTNTESVTNSSSQESTLSSQGRPTVQPNVESEVINEYFDDAQNKKYSVPTVNTNFKSYTYYKMLNRRSIQWRLQEKAYTDENGLRKIDNYYLAAMGSYYSTTIGDLFRLTTSTGQVFDIILCDGKSDRHTDSKHQYTVANNCMVEFYVDTAVLNPQVKMRGTVSVLPQFSGSIVKVESLGHYNWK